MGDATADIGIADRMALPLRDVSYLKNNGLAKLHEHVIGALLKSDFNLQMWQTNAVHAVNAAIDRQPQSGRASIKALWLDVKEHSHSVYDSLYTQVGHKPPDQHPSGRNGVPANVRGAMDYVLWLCKGGSRLRFDRGEGCLTARWDTATHQVDHLHSSPPHPSP